MNELIFSEQPEVVHIISQHCDRDGWSTFQCLNSLSLSWASVLIPSANCNFRQGRTKSWHLTRLGGISPHLSGLNCSCYKGWGWRQQNMIHKQARLITLNILREGKIKRKNWPGKLVSIQLLTESPVVICFLFSEFVKNMVTYSEGKDKVRDWYSASYSTKLTIKEFDWPKLKIFTLTCFIHTTCRIQKRGIYVPRVQDDFV